ncbi:MAG: sigma-E processing peptidase SpoIIGA [Bacilli bacterium]|nr:sigma-E processing peptidase SpoIIGA [Bacilli bacterium]
MIVYLDLVIITNLIVDYAFLKTIAVIYKEKIKWYQMLIALLIGTFSLLLFILPIKYLYNLRYIMGIFMGLSAYNTPKPMKRFLMVISFYIINLFFIGSLVIFKINNLWFLLMTMLYSIIIIVIEKVMYKKLKIKHEVLVKIMHNYLHAILDTGNHCMYKGKPVVFINHKWFDNNYQFVGFKMVKTVNQQELVKIYTGPKILFNDIEFEVLYSFSNIEDYDVILNSTMGE